MPNIASAKKNLRKSKKNNARNVVRKEAYKKALKALKKVVAGNDKEKVAPSLVAAYKALDKAAKGNVIKKNKASRLKSHAAIWVKTLESVSKK